MQNTSEKQLAFALVDYTKRVSHVDFFTKRQGKTECLLVESGQLILHKPFPLNGFRQPLTKDQISKDFV